MSSSCEEMTGKKSKITGGEKKVKRKEDKIKRGKIFQNYSWIFLPQNFFFPFFAYATLHFLWPPAYLSKVLQKVNLMGGSSKQPPKFVSIIKLTQSSSLTQLPLNWGCVADIRLRIMTDARLCQTLQSVSTGFMALFIAAQNQINMQLTAVG